MIEIEISDQPALGMQVFGPMGMEDIGMNIKDMLSNALPKNKKDKENASLGGKRSVNRRRNTKAY